MALLPRCILFLFLFLPSWCFSQSGSLKGKVTDKATGELMPFVNVVLEHNGTYVAGATSSVEGIYLIKPLAPGAYTLKASFVGYQNLQVDNILVSSDKITFFDIVMVPASTELKTVERVEYKIPLISKDNTQTGATFSKEQISNAATRDLNAVASQTAGVSQVGNGPLHFRGQRSEGTFYVVDGIKVRGGLNLPYTSIEQISVITGGVPAQYGDLTGGIINISTKGPSKSLSGSAEMVSSQFLDNYGYNLFSSSLSGPLLFKKDSVNKDPIAGYFITADFQYTKDPEPSPFGSWKLKDEKLNYLQENPLRKSSLGEGFVRNGEYVTAEDLQNTGSRLNASLKSVRLYGKFDYKPSNSITLTFGGGWDYSNSRDDILGNMRENSLFNFNNNPQNISSNMRAFVRYTQKISESQNGGFFSNFKNTYYSTQFDFNKNDFKQQDAQHKDELFKYGYVGKFQTIKSRSYNYDEDKQIAFMSSADNDTSLIFTPSDINPVLANYTKQVYELLGRVKNRQELLQMGGIMNGDPVQNIYSMYYNVGRPNDTYYQTDRRQYRFTLNGSTDFKNHNIMAGFEYEQRVDRKYSVSPVGLWNLMRQQANKHLTQLNFKDSLRVYDANGVFQDTINFARLNDGTQSVFDKNLRKKLGLSSEDQTWIDIDSYDPSFYSLNMFSADELFNNGSSIVSTYGYDVTGKIINEHNPYAFFNDKNEGGDFIRNIKPFMPVYAAGYIQDKFELNDIIFNIGLRVDRYDANQLVLKDKYSLYPIRNASDPLVQTKGNVPGSVGSDYLVYVDDYKNPQSIVGFRKGDKWYDKNGVEVEDPKTLADASATGKISPFLQDTSDNIRNPKYNVSKSFANYIPQWNIMPRIQFSFPITDEALFFAHYDILTQRPTATNSVFDPFQYYWMESFVGGILNNPDLKPTRTIDYELGFKQKLSESSAMTISAYYKEFRDMIQVMAINYAYPVSYKTYGNRDFGTSKGISFSYELRRTENVRLNASYTLQFANGTGSSATSSYNLVNAGYPNLRVPIPLDFDQRHNIVLSFDYRFDDVEKYKGPFAWKYPVFANSGINIIFRTASGVPFTQQSNITMGDVSSQNVVVGVSQRSKLKGQINGSRLPWTNSIDLKFDKNFALNLKNKKGEGKKLYLNAYILVQNLLNTKNVIKVYSYTGNANDDGFLASSENQNYIKGQLNEASFRDLYSTKVVDPSYYMLPRSIRLGITAGF